MSTESAALPVATRPPRVATGSTIAVQTHALTKAFGRQIAVDGIDLCVESGQVFGYLGPNGAGKTTTIRVLAGLLRPTSGAASVLGYDVVRERDAMQRRLGYLPGDFVAYPDLTGEEYLHFLGRLRPGADLSLAAGLAARLDLDLGRRMSALSHGNRQKVGIVQALMHRPDLVIMDEPTTGLDPIVQREFLDLLREVRDDGRTVLLSSHILSEVEAVADTVGILRRGRLVVVESVERLKARARRRLELTFRDEVPEASLARVAEVRDLTVVGSTAWLTVEGSTAALLEVAAPHVVDRIVTHEADLEDIFLAYYQNDPGPEEQ